MAAQFEINSTRSDSLTDLPSLCIRMCAKMGEDRWRDLFGLNLFKCYRAISRVISLAFVVNIMAQYRPDSIFRCGRISFFYDVDYYSPRKNFPRRLRIANKV